MTCYLKDYSFIPYDALIGSLVEKCVLPYRCTSTLQMRKERRQEFNVHKESQAILAYNWMSTNS
jgi:hypothetical protein